ncbi:hypothetical protein C943_03868 [Mariniradius saccharolyticus AK6]|jgi:hypothetical protein|uniref:Uncharacterized protein n=1 Tax=Mariniradius saccharolyticus AK6 TaxID=1239962 RepID=M7XZW5_9BACT|nr:hypothetical protein C943_03868 [Mariniradius saccharolyticus AK6]
MKITPEVSLSLKILAGNHESPKKTAKWQEIVNKTKKAHN